MAENSSSAQQPDQNKQVQFQDTIDIQHIEPTAHSTRTNMPNPWIVRSRTSPENRQEQNQPNNIQIVPDTQNPRRRGGLLGSSNSSSFREEQTSNQANPSGERFSSSPFCALQGTQSWYSNKRDIGKIAREWNIKFDGSEGSCIEDFLQRVNECRMSSHLDDNDSINAMLHVLTGPALVWCRQLRHSWVTWNDFCKAARRSYGVDQDVQMQLLAEAQARSQGKKEPVREHIFAVLAILSRLDEPPTVEAQLKMIYDNMLADIRMLVPKNEVARAAEKLIYERDNYKPPPSPDRCLLPQLAYKEEAEAKKKSGSSNAPAIAEVTEPAALCTIVATAVKEAIAQLGITQQAKPPDVPSKKANNAGGNKKQWQKQKPKGTSSVNPQDGSEKKKPPVRGLASTHNQDQKVRGSFPDPVKCYGCSYGLDTFCTLVLNVPRSREKTPDKDAIMPLKDRGFAHYAIQERLAPLSDLLVSKLPQLAVSQLHRTKVPVRSSPMVNLSIYGYVELPFEVLGRQGESESIPLELSALTEGVANALAAVGLADVTQTQRSQIDELLNRWLPSNEKPLGCTMLIKHAIEVGSARPIKQRYYPVSKKLEEEMHSQVYKMLEAGIIRRAKDSEWSSPVVMYPLPYMDSILSKLQNAQYISTIDLSNAYHQIPMREEDMHLTAFTVPGLGFFEFTRMPYSIVGGPSTFQQLSDKIIGPELEPHAFSYLDDIIITTSTFEEHLHWLEVVLKRIHEAGLTINREKNLEAVTPSMASWYRKFLDNFATIADPLTQLTRKDVNYRWGESQQMAFEQVKALIIASAPVLHSPSFEDQFPSFEDQFTIQTDASDIGLGAVLTQTIDGEERVLSFASRTLTEAERNYSVTERECLAVLWAIRKFRAYVEGYHFEVITATVVLNGSAICGSLHCVPDALSRMYEDEESEAQLASIDAEDDCTSDAWYNELKAQVVQNPTHRPHWKVIGGKLYHLRPDPLLEDILDDQEAWKLVLPSDKVAEVLWESHCEPTAGHIDARPMSGSQDIFTGRTCIKMSVTSSKNVRSVNKPR
ncbi:uncharacterized protein LOC116418038 [Nasonia vitripennis]|uniref:Reverse transcriptase domain-containing protein n=1 Tax=Nasonia vitripennis TaxID=7425 RepID=A0A7M7QN86_NASVI|nr:uncharacterized protein LOC116418038 [Nasonia vitripennis]